MHSFDDDNFLPGTTIKPQSGSDATPELRRMLLAGDLFGDYDILGVLGRGGMGIVYKARQRTLNRIVALKVVNPNGLLDTPELLRFLFEAEAAAQLRHPNIAQVYELGSHENILFYSLEYLEGGTLKYRLSKERQTPRQAAIMVETLARGIAAAHEAGILHRDLKPSNILVSGPVTQPLEECVLKITDFGLARRIDAESGQTLTGQILGTPAYMAPEQAMPRSYKNQLGPPTDIYALGIILYEILTGRPPFLTDAAIETINLIRNTEPISPLRFRPGLPRDLVTVCMRCLEKSPNKRYPHAIDLAEDLHRFLNNQTIKARRPSIWDRVNKLVRRHPSATLLISGGALSSITIAALLISQSIEQRNRYDLARNQWEDAVIAGQELRLQGDFPAARDRLQHALSVIANEPALQESILPTQKIYDDILKQQENAELTSRALSTFQQFLRYRDEALFYGSQFTGLDVLTNFRSARTSARTALGMYRIWTPTTPATAPSVAGISPLEGLSVADRSRVREDCVELALVLVDLEQVLPDEPGDPLFNDRMRMCRDLLDRIAAWAPISQAYQVRLDDLQKRLDPDATSGREKTRWDRTADGKADRDRRLPLGAIDHFLAGKAALERKDLLVAISHFREVLLIRPNHAWASYYAAIAHALLGQYRESLAYLNTYFVSRPDDAWPLILRAHIHGKLGEDESALRDFARARELSDGDRGLVRFGLLVNRGLFHFERDRYEAAAADFHAATALRPEQFQPYQNLAMIAQRENRPNDALRLLSQARLRAPSEAIGTVRLLEARIRLSLGQREQAETALTEAFRSPGVTRKTLAGDYAELGRMILESGDALKAVVCFDQSLVCDPNLVIAHYGRGEALVPLERFDESLQSLDRAIVLGGRGEELYRARGKAYARLGKYGNALEDYTTALNLNPNQPEARTRRGWALLSSADQLAQNDFDAVLSERPDADALAGRGLARAGLGAITEALADADQALVLAPDTWPITANAAAVYARAWSSLHNGVARRQPQESEDRIKSRALDLLETAVSQIPDKERAKVWTNALAGDPVYGPLRDSPRFQALQQRYNRP